MDVIRKLEKSYPSFWFGFRSYVDKRERYNY